MATVRIPVVRVGDTSKVSAVRVHTKDGSAVSGEDYYPVSQGERHAASSLLNALVSGGGGGDTRLIFKTGKYIQV